MPRRPPAPPAAPSEDDAALFREAVGPVRPVAPDAEPPPSPARPHPTPRQQQADEADALRQSRREPFGGDGGELGDASLYRRPEVPARVLKRLRRGLYSVQDEIDLHGLPVASAEPLLRGFLAQARAEGRHCLRIVHGKGLHSGPEGPQIRPLVERMLSQRAEVLAYASAPAAQGGSGATLVLLAPAGPRGRR